MRLLHTATKTHARFDDPNLVSHAGLIPAVRLAQNIGLEDLVAQHVRVAAKVGANPGLKIGSLVAGMVAGADTIDGMDLLRHGAFPATVGGIRAPSTLGSFLRAFDHGNVRQLAAVHRRVLTELAGRAPLLPGADTVAFVDVDSVQRRVYGGTKQGAAFGHAKIASKSLLVRGLNVLAATVSTPLAAPVVAAARLRGGNAGSAFGPLLAAASIIPYGQGNVAWFGLFAVFALFVLYRISRWYANHLSLFKLKQGHAATHGLSKGRVIGALVVLGLLVFSKYFYMASLTSYFTFYLIEKFGLSVASSQLHLFLFLGAVAAGTFFGGPIGDRIGRKAVIWFSILGVAPFTLILPHVDLFWTSVLSVVIGFILASAFSAIVVYAQELVPGNVGMIAGVFFGLMFGFGGIGAALLGHLADIHGIEYVYLLCSFLPLFGVLAVFLPRTIKA